MEEKKYVFIVLEDSAFDFVASIGIYAYDSKEKAIEKKNELIEQSGIRDEIDDDYVCNEDEMYFEAYPDGDYCENHYVVSVNEEEVR